MDSGHMTLIQRYNKREDRKSEEVQKAAINIVHGRRNGLGINAVLVQKVDSHRYIYFAK